MKDAAVQEEKENVAALPAPSWALDALCQVGEIAYRWNLHDDQMSWWSHGLAFGDFAWPDRGHQMMSRIHPNDVPRRMEALTQHFQELDLYECEYRLRMNDGTFVWILDRGRMQGSYLTGLMRVISTQKEAEEDRLEAQLRDPLTQLISVRRFIEEIERFVRLRRAQDNLSGLMIIDYARSDLVSDTSLMDKALAVLGAALDRIMAPLDAATRLEHCRFALLIASADRQRIEEYARALAQAVGELATTVSLPQPLWKIRFGSSLFPGELHRPEDIINAAQTALQKARSRHLDHVHNMPAISAHYLMATTHAAALRQARSDDHLCLFYQPIVRANDYSICLYESLLRQRGTKGEIVNAARLIPDLELLGDMRWLDCHVLDLATSTLLARSDLTLSINISGLTVGDANWARALRFNLQRRPDIARRLIVEITETTAVDDAEETLRFIRLLRHLGCRVAIDDFGAGFTSFRQLRGLPVDMVKIDGEFIRDLETNTDHQLFIRHLATLARELSFVTIAEFVETPRQAALLQQAGIDYLQGYFFGGPQALASGGG
ncbi:MAG TPA: EAL domain-containing protein [Dongiaceae bacterium]|jgi:EAL domain-containing protein (putative c-di-GMP-specific phosphodiesterase class I)/GGDEF domain-containing protein|nr:EAL domain-containing protein [Dongiaceae bacterium]